MAPGRPLVGARREENLHPGVREYHRAHVAPIGHQARRHRKAPLPLQEAPRGPSRQRRDLGGVVAGRLGADVPVTSVPSSQTTSSPAWIGAEAYVKLLRHAAQASGPSAKSPPPIAARPARPGGTAHHYRADPSPARLAAARLTVPLPDPDGPSIVRHRPPYPSPPRGADSIRSSPAARARVHEAGERGGHVGHVANAQGRAMPAGSPPQRTWRCGDRRDCRSPASAVKGGPSHPGPRFACRRAAPRASRRAH